MDAYENIYLITLLLVMDRLLSKQLTLNHELIVADNRSDDELSGNNSAHETEGLILLLIPTH